MFSIFQCHHFVRNWSSVHVRAAEPTKSINNCKLVAYPVMVVQQHPCIGSWTKSHCTKDSHCPTYSKRMRRTIPHSTPFHKSPPCASAPISIVSIWSAGPAIKPTMDNRKKHIFNCKSDVSITFLIEMLQLPTNISDLLIMRPNYIPRSTTSTTRIESVRFGAGYIGHC